MANGNQDELDRLLDDALVKYASEPRAGLEERVLANLRAEAAHRAVRTWWQWSVLAALAAMAVIAVALSWRTGWHPTTPVAATTPTTQSIATQVAGSGEQSGVRLPAGRGTRKTLTHRAAAAAVVAAPPKLDQFPSPQPLSDQERALARYVRQFPLEAGLIAQAQEEYEKEMQKEMRNANSGDEEDSDEKER